MSTRPLDRLPTIRGKLGSTIVFAVGMTVVLIFLMLGYALRGSARDSDRLQLARDLYGAYVSGDREVVERMLSDDFEFYSPADVGMALVEDEEHRVGFGA